MSLRWHGTAVDAADPARLARWWAEVLHLQIMHEQADVVAIARDEQTYPGMLFVRQAAAKAGKNRLHLELACDDLAADVERLVDMGARHVDIDPGSAPWVVLADPEGNEFRVIAQRSAAR
jgi:predicted enzyme related to lactoylglutathione lyase